MGICNNPPNSSKWSCVGVRAVMVYRDVTTTIELLLHLKELGVEIRAENDKLRIDAPSGVINSALRQELLKRKAEILEFIVSSSSSIINYHMPIQTISREENLPLSFSQERLWFLSQMEAESPAYKIAGAVRLEGRLQVDILTQSLNEIVRRHEILRTTFEEIEGKQEQVISDGGDFNLQVVDLQEHSEAGRQARSQRIIADEVQRSFDLSKGPLLRAVLMQFGELEHILVVVMHHIITDGWSLGVLTRELGVLYAAFSEGKPSPLPELHVQYADYAAWQREWLQGEVLAQVRGGHRAIGGVMLESFLAEGRQDWRAGQPLRPGLSLTDACVGWDETEALLRAAAQTLRSPGAPSSTGARRGSGARPAVRQAGLPQAAPRSPSYSAITCRSG